MPRLKPICPHSRHAGRPHQELHTERRNENLLPLSEPRKTESQAASGGCSPTFRLAAESQPLGGRMSRVHWLDSPPIPFLCGPTFTLSEKHSERLPQCPEQPASHAPARKARARGAGLTGTPLTLGLKWKLFVGGTSQALHTTAALRRETLRSPVLSEGSLFSISPRN